MIFPIVEVKGRLLENTAATTVKRHRNRAPVKQQTKQNAILESQLKACNRTSDLQTRVERTPSQEKSLAEMTTRKYTPFIMLYQPRDGTTVL